MSSHAKVLKVAGIITFLAGIALVVTALAMMVITHFALESMCLFAAGGFCLFLGREAAKAANVPSTAGEIVFSGGSAAVFTLGLAIGSWFAAGRQLNLCVGLIPVAFVLCVVVTVCLVRTARIEEQV